MNSLEKRSRNDRCFFRSEIAKAEFCGAARFHAERIIIDEAKRPRQTDAQRRKSRSQFRIGLQRRIVKDLQSDGARVFGISIHVTRPQGLPHRWRTAPALLVFDRRAGPANQLRGHFRQQCCFGILLGSDGYGGRTPTTRDHHNRSEQPCFHASDPLKNSVGRWA